jgi:hypothetical protein
LQIRRKLPRRGKIEALRLFVEKPDPTRREIEKAGDDLERSLERERFAFAVAERRVDRFENPGVVAMSFR